ncbi:MAG: hypothetical protein KAJ95_05020 [Gammaproteobacteria bacterium]|nr:hypothetical protein [Gammaproteobacteria bacterium]
MNKYDRNAAAQKVIMRDAEAGEGLTYNEKETRRAIVHSRQDMTQVVVHLSFINKQLRWVRFLLILIFLALLMIMIP